MNKGEEEAEQRTRGRRSSRRRRGSNLGLDVPAVDVIGE